jgi:hypothetical protein
MSLITTKKPRLGAWCLVAQIGLVGLSSGCMSRQLQFATARTTSTLLDLHYQQVVDNLAHVAANPGYLPYLAVAGQGSIQVTNSGNASFPANWTLAAAGQWLPSLTASTNVTGTWSLGTVTSPEKIRAMQAYYRDAVQRSKLGDPAFGWLHVGGKHEVNKNASYVSHHGPVHVWIDPEGITGLSELVLEILDIATREDNAPAPLPAPLNHPLSGAAGPPSVPRRNFQVPPSGPVFTPGTP